ncbi:hypothetical protein M2459_000256 [Parabacteroides sp. PF5-5]|uniref:DUF6515 family protein n=1 Tax=unclassified Parabacteroides TaxID=2649774 RepID=UPI002474D7EB|nr:MULTISPECIES: DUF6515 family protein [unclassified Parabacteroides]MDH6303924.1 hypothetical protein [Parabacteroides sp. PH5-39]MDH6314541.1 hypothetical protein [Parabacteroides sp. PF5-13]MDH6318394.1 hypothetical protein [Parabacteroides sp. PH5-13]MDH6322313.1 hypothetical protein [Parabacteroides sp. PH5-8]MDH6325607.1 hypothetical protein [Parabacteroides sp. PH5-41]
MKAKVIFLLVAVLALPIGMQAQNWKKNKNKNRQPVTVEKRYNNRAPAHRYERTVTVLPHGYRQIRHNNGVYYYAQGNYYRALPNRYYEVIRPQIGMIIPDLPHYRKVIYKGRAYYAYQDYLYSRVRTPGGISFRLDIRL